MSRLTDLLRQASKTDPQLARDLEAEFQALLKRRSFGLVFERHQPEAVELPGRPVKRGDKVHILPPRGSTKKGDNRLWRVIRIEGKGDERQGHLTEIDAAEPQERVVPLTDLIVVAEFRDTIYPGLVETGRVERGGDKPFHTVINAENFHALETLTYTHRHRVDAIYIDPPYNTGARDWKYNNDYVEGDDDYRHSKWLSMMERRLKVARELLNPANSVLIVTIDEKEYLRLGLLLDQVFPEANIQMVTSVISQSGQPRGNQMSRVEEYIFVVYIGAVKVGQDVTDAPSDDQQGSDSNTVIWENLIRRGTSARRVDRENQFYPFFIDPTTNVILGVGDALLPVTTPRNTITVPLGQEIVWPVRSDGTEGRWRISAPAARNLLNYGLLRVGRANKTTGQRAMNYILRSDIARIEAGEIVVDGKNPDGSAILRRTAGKSTIAGVPKTVWNKDSHNAGNHGSSLLRLMIPGRSFPYPKSLYAVEDTLRLFLKDNPDAVILDFFSGSGTTAHAVMRLNRQDGGRRQCILVTNNEVAADEHKRLREAGLRPGDQEWEQWGICDYITKPRIQAAITGKTPNDEPIKGDYKFTDEFPMSEGFEENAAFFTLTYESPRMVAHHRAFQRIAPLLWLRAGAQGKIIESLGKRGWALSEYYGVLENMDESLAFIAAVSAAGGVRTAFIVTDDDSAFQLACRDLPAGVRPLQLYESYLTNFEITSGRMD